MSVWSPQSDAFVYAGSGVNGDTGIWAQRLDAGEPELIATGVYAAWSPR